MLKLILNLLLIAQAEPQRLRVAYPAEGTIISAQVGLVFEKTDILKKHGFTGTATAMGTGRELKTALVSGQADVIFTSQTNFVVLLGNGYDAYAIQSLGSAGRLALVVLPQSPLRAVADLKGKKLATIFGTSIHQPALEWLQKANLQNSVEVLNLSSQAALQSALQVGAVQAIMTWDPFLADGLERGRYRTIQHQDFDLITVASPTFHQQREAVERFNAATREALLYVAQHKSEVNDWFSRMAKLEAKTIDTASRLNTNYGAQRLEEVVLRIPARLRQQMQREAEFLFAKKFLTRKPDLAKHID